MSSNTDRSPENGRFLLLAAGFGLVTTLAFYRGFGTSNHLEQLPLILRALDPAFLTHDFFTSAGSASIARLYYTQLIAWLAGSEAQLPAVFLLLTLGANIATSVITYVVGRDLFDDSPRTGIYAAALVMSVSTFQLGWHDMLYADLLIPTTLALPFLLAAIHRLMRGQLGWGVLLCGLASVLHPLVGLEGGGLLLLSYLGYQVVQEHALTRRTLGQVLLGALILAPFAALSLLPELTQPHIATSEFISILAYFRHPHHYLPSTFPKQEYLSAAAFLCAAGLALQHARQTRPVARLGWLTALVSVVLLLYLGGYVFVELIPVRLWVIAQTPRLLYLLQWAGLLLIGNLIADPDLVPARKALYVASALHPLALGAVVTAQAFSRRLERRLPAINGLVDPVLLFASLAIFRWRSVPLLEIVVLGLFVFAIGVILIASERWLYAAVLPTSLLALAMAPAVVRVPWLHRSSSLQRISQGLQLSIRSELGSDGDEVAAFARDHTPADSIFLTPPAWGQFRLLARRAIVVDILAFPFADQAIAEWHARVVTCYGDPVHKGLAMGPELDGNYHRIADATLQTVEQKYQASFAVLYLGTPTSFPVVYQNDKYKVVRLTDPNQDLTSRPAWARRN